MDYDFFLSFPFSYSACCFLLVFFPSFVLIRCIQTGNPRRKTTTACVGDMPYWVRRCRHPVRRCGGEHFKGFSANWKLCFRLGSSSSSAAAGIACVLEGSEHKWKTFASREQQKITIVFVHLKYFEGLGKLPFSEVENMFSLNFKILPDASEMARKV